MMSIHEGILEKTIEDKKNPFLLGNQLNIWLMSNDVVNDNRFMNFK